MRKFAIIIILLLLLLLLKLFTTIMSILIVNYMSLCTASVNIVTK